MCRIYFSQTDIFCGWLWVLPDSVLGLPSQQEILKSTKEGCGLQLGSTIFSSSCCQDSPWRSCRCKISFQECKYQSPCLHEKQCRNHCFLRYHSRSKLSGIRCGIGLCWWQKQSSWKMWSLIKKYLFNVVQCCFIDILWLDVQFWIEVSVVSSREMEFCSWVVYQSYCRV